WVVGWPWGFLGEQVDEVGFGPAGAGEAEVGVGQVGQQVGEGVVVVAAEVAGAVVDEQDAAGLVVVDVEPDDGDGLGAAGDGGPVAVVAGDDPAAAALGDDGAVEAVGVQAGLDGGDVASPGVLGVLGQPVDRH